MEKLYETVRFALDTHLSSEAKALRECMKQNGMKRWAENWESSAMKVESLAKGLLKIKKDINEKEFMLAIKRFQQTFLSFGMEYSKMMATVLEKLSTSCIATYKPFLKRTHAHAREALKRTRSNLKSHSLKKYTP